MNDFTIDTTDLELVEMVKRSNKAAFSALVRRHQLAVFRLAMRFMKNKQAAEDVVQEAFIKAYERIATFEARASFKSWLFQIAVNTAKNKLRERRDSMDIDDVHVSVAPLAESGLVHGSVADVLQELVDALPPRQRTALMLRVYEDLSFKEIAEVMQCPYDTAKANYRHALMKLKVELEENLELRKWTEEVGGFVMDMTRRAAEAE
jgi:RNA polymerase sigma-70 factor (ECF subfamily)